MGISLAPELDEAPDPLKPKKPAAPMALPGPSTPPAIGLAPAPQAPGKAGGVAPAPLSASIPPSAYGNMATTAPAPTVAPPSAPVDRVKLATETFGNIAGQRQQQFDADARDEIRRSAGLGQIASGGLRTRYGNLRLARDRDLDTLQKDLSLKAAEASVADASTAYQQGLAGAQHGLAEKIGLAGIDTQKGALGLEKDALALQEKLGLGGLNAEQQRIAIAQKQQDIEAAFQSKQMTLAERNAALAELAQAQQNALGQEQIGLERERVGIAKGAQEIANKVALGQLSIAQASQALEEKVRTGQLSLEEAKLAMDKINSTRSLDITEQNADTARLAQILDEKVRTGQLSIEQARQQLAEETQRQQAADTKRSLDITEQNADTARMQLEQSGKQFGLSLAQQKGLAEMANTTQKYGIDKHSAQAKNALLLELMKIMGTSDFNNLDPAFIEAVSKALGIDFKGKTSNTTQDYTPDDGDDEETTNSDGILP